MRVLDWIIQRCNSGAEAVQTPIGLLPAQGALNLDGIELPEETLKALLSVDKERWLAELGQIQKYLQKFGDRTPEGLIEECQRVSAALQSS